MKKILAGTFAGIASIAMASAALASSGGGSANTNLSQIFQKGTTYSSSTATPISSPPAGSSITSVSLSWKLSRSMSGVSVQLCGTVTGCAPASSGLSGSSGTLSPSTFNGSTSVGQGFYVKTSISGTGLISPALYQGAHTITVNYVY